MKQLGPWCVGCLLIVAVAQAQRPLGTVSTEDASVANKSGGVVQVGDGRATLIGSATVTAKDHTAEIALARGGKVLVCQSTGLHLNAAPDDSLLIGIDRGAMELHGAGQAGDVVVTPDLRFTLATAGPLELSMRVTFNGDTCVENRGRKAPTLKIADAFGDASYELRPGQHVLFEHGSLREVVDNETTPCGCPPDGRQGKSLADALLASNAPRTPAQAAAAAHPFPAAQSEGLAGPDPLPAQAAGVTHVETGTTLVYDPSAAATSPVPPQQTTAAPAPPPANSPVKKQGGPLAAVGRFFKRLFVR